MMKIAWDSNSTITLGEAIQTMRALASEGNLAEQISAENARSLEQHDAVHILFNCGTSIRDEIAVHLWMLLATTIDISRMHRAVADREHRDVLAGIGHFKLLGIWLSSLPRIFGIIVQSFKMPKKLAVEDLAALKQRPVLDIRQEYGIVVGK